MDASPARARLCLALLAGCIRRVGRLGIFVSGDGEGERRRQRIRFAERGRIVRLGIRHVFRTFEKLEHIAIVTAGETEIRQGFRFDRVQQPPRQRHALYDIARSNMTDDVFKVARRGLKAQRGKIKFVQGRSPDIEILCKYTVLRQGRQT